MYSGGGTPEGVAKGEEGGIWGGEGRGGKALDWAVALSASVQQYHVSLLYYFVLQVLCITAVSHIPWHMFTYDTPGIIQQVNNIFFGMQVGTYQVDCRLYTPRDFYSLEIWSLEIRFTLVVLWPLLLEIWGSIRST